MKWFKHFTNWHYDPDIYDGFSEYGHLAYVFLLFLREMYALQYENRDQDGFVRLSCYNFTRVLRVKAGKVRGLFDFYKNRNRIDYYFANDYYHFKVIEFEKLIGNWRDRQK